MSFRRLHLSFTERRRRRLAKKVDRLDRLESRTTITEPISFTGLAISALRGIVQLGLMSPFGASNAPNPLARAGETAKTAGRVGPKPYALPANLLKSIDAIAVDHVAGSGSTGTASSSSSAANHAGSDASNDWLTLNAKPIGNQADSDGISTPWHPAKGPGGGPAQAPRGGTSASRGTQNTARGAITPLRLPASTPAASAGGGASAALLAAVAGASGTGAQTASPGVGGALPVPKISLVHAGAGAASGAGNQGGGGVTISADADPGPTPSGGSTPLPGSTPDPVTGNASGVTEDVSEPFNVYVLDNQAGVVLYPGVEQLATLDGWMDLIAQVQGATVSSYSWNTTSLPATSISGTSTDQLNFRWDNDNESGIGYVTSVTLSVTDTSSQTLTYTYSSFAATKRFTGRELRLAA
jgi:hypothetical protein